ncbi:MAG: hypothetical protein ACP5I8_08190 [Phycisphaerae bacterium]
MEQTADVEAKLRHADKLIARYTGAADPAHQLKLARTIFTKGALLIQARRFAPALAAFDLLLQMFQDSKDETIQGQVAKTLLDRAAVLDILGRRDDALGGYDDLLRRFQAASTATIRGYVASAMFNKASLLTRLNRGPEALMALNECLEDHIQLPDRLLAKALWMKVTALRDSGRDNQSLAACTRLITDFSNKKEIVDQNWLCEIMLEQVNLLITLDRAPEVINAYQAAEERFGPVAEEVMGAKTAECLVQALQRHLALNRITEALTLAEKALNAFGNFVDPPWLDVVRTAGKARVMALCRLGRVEACLAAYDSAVEHSGEVVDLALRRGVAALLLDQSTIRATRRDYAAADKLCDDLIQRFTSSEDTDLATLCARAMFNKIALRAYMGKADAVMPACDAFIDRFRYSTHPVICEMLFHAWSRKAAALDSQRHDAEALAAYDAALKAGQSLALPPLPVATIMASKAACLARLSRRAEQLATYDDLLAAFADNTAPGVRAVVAPVLLARAFMLREDGRLEEALAACRQFIARVEHGTPATLLVPLARAMFLRGELLEKLERDTEAVAAYAAVTARFDFNGETESRQCIPVALFNQAALLEKTGRHEESLQTLNQFLDRAREESDLIPTRLLAQAMRNRAAILEELHNSDAAMTAYQEVVTAFRSVSDSTIVPLVIESLFRRAELLRQVGKLHESLADYQAIQTYGEPPEISPSQKQIVTTAAFDVAAVLAALDKPMEALAAYDTAVQRFGAVADQWVRAEIAGTLEHLRPTGGRCAATVRRELATVLGRRMEQALQSGDFDTALTIGEAMRERFQHDSAPEVLGGVERAAEIAIIIAKKRREIMAAAEAAEAQRKAATLAPQMAAEPAPDAAKPSIIESIAEPIPALSVTAEAPPGPVHTATPAEVLAAPAANTAVAITAPTDPAAIPPPPVANATFTVTTVTETTANTDHAATDLDVAAAQAQLAHLQSSTWHGHGVELDAACDQFIKQFGDSKLPGIRHAAAEAFRIKIELVKENGSLEDELRVCNEFMIKFGRETDTAFAPVLCRTMLDRGRVLGQMDRPGHELAAYDALLLRFGNSTAPALRAEVIEAFMRQAAIAGRQGRIGDEVRCYQKFVGKFGTVPETDVQRQVATAMLGTGLAFRKLDRKLDELAVYDAIIQRFGKNADTGILSIAVRAMMRKALTLGERGKRLEQIAVYDAVIARFAEADSPLLRQQAARSQYNRAMALTELGKIADALAGYDAVLAKYSQAADPPLRACAGLALFQKAELLRKQRRRAEAITCYQHFIQGYQMDDEEISGLITQAQALLRIL